MKILITGPTGSGKTDTAWALLEATQDMIFLDCDWFAARRPFSWSEPNDLESVFGGIREQIAFHRKQERTNFVITLTVEMAEAYERHGHYFHDAMDSLHCFRLLCSPAILESRIRNRDRIQKEEEVTNSEILSARLDSLYGDDTIFTRVDTSKLTSLEVAESILQHLRPNQPVEENDHR